MGEIIEFAGAEIGAEAVEDMKKEIEYKMSDKDKKIAINKVIGKLEKKSNNITCDVYNRMDNKNVRKFMVENKRKIDGKLSRKRFRKLLYSVGYGREAAGEIIDIEWKYKGYYDLDDLRYWESVTKEK